MEVAHADFEIASTGTVWGNPSIAISNPTSSGLKRKLGAGNSFWSPSAPSRELPPSPSLSAESTCLRGFKDAEGYSMICFCTECQDLFLAQESSGSEFNPTTNASDDQNLVSSVTISTDVSVRSPSTSSSSRSPQRQHKATKNSGISKTASNANKTLRPEILIDQLEVALHGDEKTSSEFKWKASVLFKELKTLIENESANQQLHIEITTPVPSSLGRPRKKGTKKSAGKNEPYEKIYHCTKAKCKYSTSSAMDWRRHEETHWPQKRYMCIQCPNSAGNSGLSKCSFCLSMLATVETQSHYLQCESARRNGRTFARKDKLSEHLQKDHSIPPGSAMSQATNCTFQVDNGWPRQCGFCSILFETWDERAGHLIEGHFKRGEDLRLWQSSYPTQYRRGNLNDTQHFDTEFCGEYGELPSPSFPQVLSQTMQNQFQGWSYNQPSQVTYDPTIEDSSYTQDLNTTATRSLVPEIYHSPMVTNTTAPIPIPEDRKAELARKKGVLTSLSDLRKKRNPTRNEPLHHMLSTPSKDLPPPQVLLQPQATLPNEQSSLDTSSKFQPPTQYVFHHPSEYDPTIEDFDYAPRLPRQEEITQIALPETVLNPAITNTSPPLTKKSRTTLQKAAFAFLRKPAQPKEPPTTSRPQYTPINPTAETPRSTYSRPAPEPRTETLPSIYNNPYNSDPSPYDPTISDDTPRDLSYEAALLQFELDQEIAAREQFSARPPVTEQDLEFRARVANMRAANEARLAFQSRSMEGGASPRFLSAKIDSRSPPPPRRASWFDGLALRLRDRGSGEKTQESGQKKRKGKEVEEEETGLSAAMGGLSVNEKKGKRKSGSSSNEQEGGRKRWSGIFGKEKIPPPPPTTLQTPKSAVDSTSNDLDEISFLPPLELDLGPEIKLY
ncbi:uncharacterized protein LY89DRAFT_716823 [Mollisia scopiformis]|uniref:C2H2-type domain-containing protein n=1 Tax=Mollisia scopiformis TaxID=149040 RepID=A0A194XGJ8_MOLSC|nr:uncharacterized protein LY89DRAFT_716823 [Mollisia scopiformis]KUJ19259.1 hypothetical protein LY89DRAFT_716823 [Mollisia scopiformis]